MKKRILSMLIVVVMLVGMIPSLATAASAATYNGTTGDVNWSFDDTTGTLTVSGMGAMADYTNGSQPWYAYKDSITTVIIEKGVTTISTNAFSQFFALETVKIAGSVTAIGNNAFYSCSDLDTVEYYGSSDPQASSTAFFGSYAVVKVLPTYEGTVFCGIVVRATLDAANEPVPAAPEAPNKNNVRADVIFAFACYNTNVPPLSFHQTTGIAFDTNYFEVGVPVKNTAGEWTAEVTGKVKAMWEERTSEIYDLSYLGYAHTPNEELPEALTVTLTWDPAAEEWVYSGEPFTYDVSCKAPHTVTYHANNGTDATATETVEDGSDVELTYDKFTYLNCEIVGWNTEPDGSGISYSEDTYYGGTVTDITKDIDLYAEWVLPLYKLDSFANDDYEWSGKDSAPYSFTMKNGATLYASVIFPSKSSEETATMTVDGDCTVKGALAFETGTASAYSNYKFDLTITGNDDSSLTVDDINQSGAGDTLAVEVDVTVGSGLSLGSSGGADSILIVKDAELTLAGSMGLLQYLTTEGEAKLNIGGIFSFNSDPTISLSDDTIIYINGNGWQDVLYKEGADNTDAFDKLFADGWLPEGYTFGADSWGYALVDETGASSLGPVTLQKQKKQIFTVTVLPCENGSVTADPIEAPAGETINLTGTPDTGYTLEGFTVTDASGAPVTVMNNSFTMPASNVNVTARFKANSHSIIYQVDGEEYKRFENVAYGTPLTPIDAPVKEGHTFSGWSPVPATMPDGNVYVNGTFTVNSYTLTFKPENGADDIVSTVKFGTPITTPAGITKLGHTLVGWGTVADTMPASDVTYTAQWTANVYSVTLVTKGGKINRGNITEYTYGVGAELPENVTKRDYTFEGWYDNKYYQGEPVTEITATDIGDKIFYAKWKEIPDLLIPVYEVELADGITGGEVEASKYLAAKGKIITVTADPDEGYALKELTVTDSDGDEVKLTKVSDTEYTFKMPGSDVLVDADFEGAGSTEKPDDTTEKPDDTTDKPGTPADGGDCPKDHTCPIHPFSDAKPTEWYHDGVHYCIARELMQGYEDGTFGPETATTRAMIVTILWRLENKPVVNYLMSFKDVEAEAWYTEAVRWAAAERIVEGYSAEAFGPHDIITREQMATIVYRYSKYKGYDVSALEKTDIVSYADAAAVSDWAATAMRYACGAGLIQGIADGNSMKLDPLGSATRSQAATILYRYILSVEAAK